METKVGEVSVVETEKRRESRKKARQKEKRKREKREKREEGKDNKCKKEWKIWDKEEEVVKSEEKAKKLVLEYFHKWTHIFGKKQSERMPTRKL